MVNRESPYTGEDVEFYKIGINAIILAVAWEHFWQSVRDHEDYLRKNRQIK